MFHFFYKPDYKIPAEGIDQIDKVTIGGVKQQILIQSYNKNNPVILFLHGGPSMPLPGVSSRGKDYTIVTNTKKLVQHYTVVFWDQRGTGKSYHDDIPKETMNFWQYVHDADELIDYLRSKFNQDKIYLVGHSYGSLIGIYLAHQCPEKLHSYVGISQIISWTENDKLCYKWAKDEANRRNDVKALKELDSIGEPPYVNSYKQWGVLRKYQIKYSSMIYSDNKVKHPGLFKITLDMLISKDYRFKDAINAFYKGHKLIYTDEFIKDIPTYNAKKDIRGLKVPVTFIHGRKDVHVHDELLLEYIHSLEMNQKPRVIWSEKSSHIFHPDDTALIEKILIEEILIDVKKELA
ncbi:alpha/beta hydrolase [Bacillus sp. M6-12]|uniref:alpha/beta hydrolase n=1 Tax=Bacillus sp. M6-12 TaxID=2054166 RepID=UPI0021551F50|nr:alpha/beta hydrolase [Bacillus sp. M6-12]